MKRNYAVAGSTLAAIKRIDQSLKHPDTFLTVSKNGWRNNLGTFRENNDWVVRFTQHALKLILLVKQMAKENVVGFKSIIIPEGYLHGKTGRDSVCPHTHSLVKYETSDFIPGIEEARNRISDRELSQLLSVVLSETDSLKYSEWGYLKGDVSVDMRSVYYTKGAVEYITKNYQHSDQLQAYTTPVTTSLPPKLTNKTVQLKSIPLDSTTQRQKQFRNHRLEEANLAFQEFLITGDYDSLHQAASDVYSVIAFRESRRKRIHHKLSEREVSRKRRGRQNKGSAGKAQELERQARRKAARVRHVKTLDDVPSYEDDLFQQVKQSIIQETKDSKEAYKRIRRARRHYRSRKERREQAILRESRQRCSDTQRVKLQIRLEKNKAWKEGCSINQRSNTTEIYRKAATATVGSRSNHYKSPLQSSFAIPSRE